MIVLLKLTAKTRRSPNGFRICSSSNPVQAFNGRCSGVSTNDLNVSIGRNSGGIPGGTTDTGRSFSATASAIELIVSGASALSAVTFSSPNDPSTGAYAIAAQASTTNGSLSDALFYHLLSQVTTPEVQSTITPDAWWSAALTGFF